MQRFIFGIVFFSFCMLSFSAGCMAFSKIKAQFSFCASEEISTEEKAERELGEELSEIQMIVPGEFVFVGHFLKFSVSNSFRFILKNNFKLIRTPPPRN